MKKHIIAFILVLVIVAGSLVGCNTQRQAKKDEISYQVVKSIRFKDGWEAHSANFEYNSDNNSVLVSFLDNNGDVMIQHLLFVNRSGAVTSIHSIIDGYQDTWLEEEPETIFNDAGGIKEIVYSDEGIKFLFSYNNYIENILTSISFCTLDKREGWQTKSVSTNDSFDFVEEIKYEKLTNSRFILFENILWYFSMLDVA